MKKQILNDENLLCSLELEDMQVSAYLLYRGSSRLQYYLFYKEELLFEGNDYRPAPGWGIESLESMVELLSMLTTRPGDTDPEFFQNYSTQQLEWCTTEECAKLRLLASFFGIEGELKKSAEMRLKPAFKTY